MQVLKNMGNKIKSSEVNRIASKIKRYLYYEKKITPRLLIKHNEAFDLFLKDQNLTCVGSKKVFLIKLNNSGENSVLSKRAIRKPRKEKREGYSKYKDYLQSDEWQEVRKRVFLERGRRCERCGKDLENKIADVHHKTYENLFNEKLEDLEVLCRPCHQEEHKDKRHSKEKKKLSFEQRCEMLKTTKGRRKLRKAGYKVSGAENNI